MSEHAVDLTLLSTMTQSLERELRLLRLVVDNMMPRVASIEQSFHGLVAEMSRGFGQMQQQLGRHEARLDAVQAGLSSLQTALSDSTDRIMRELQAQRQ